MDAEITSAATQAGISLSAGSAGIVAHYVKKWIVGEIRGSLYDYLFRHYGRRTAATVMTFIGGALTGILTGHMDGMTWQQLTLASFTSGYAIDSLANKGQRKAPSKI